MSRRFPSTSGGTVMRLPMLVVGGALALGSLALVVESQRPYACTVDEPAWITSGYLGFRLLVDGAAPDRWGSAFDAMGLGDWGAKNPPVGKVLFGAAVALARSEGEPVAFMWQWGRSYRDNLTGGHIPPLHLMQAARLVSACCGAGCLVLVFLLARRWCGRPLGALVAPLSLFFLPVFQFHATHVYTDVPQLFLLLLAVVLFREPRRGRGGARFVASLLALGLSCATKFSSAPVVVALSILMLFGDGRWWRRALGSALVPSLAFAFFVLANPYLYPAPIARTRALIADWSRSKAEQQRDPSASRGAVLSPWVGLESTLVHAVLRPAATPRLDTETLVWARRQLPVAAAVGAAMIALVLSCRPPRFRERPVPRRSVVVLAGTGACVVASVLAGSTGPVFGGLCALGLGRSWSQLAASRDPGDGLAVLFVVVFLFTGWWLPFDWARYYLPVVVFTTVAWSLGVAVILDLFAPGPWNPRLSALRQALLPAVAARPVDPGGDRPPEA